jgi:AP-1 complex subunit beta-1
VLFFGLSLQVIMRYMSFIKNPKLEQLLVTEKLPPPLITLLSEQKSEIQYVALRNINLIVQKVPDILAAGVKHFFVKYNDPIFVKMEKLEIMIKLASVKNIEKVLLEFKEYASEVDVEFVRKVSGDKKHSAASRLVGLA